MGHSIAAKIEVKLHSEWCVPTSPLPTCASFPGPHPLRLCPSCCVAYTWASDSPRARVPECGDKFRENVSERCVPTSPLPTCATFQAPMLFVYAQVAALLLPGLLIRPRARDPECGDQFRENVSERCVLTSPLHSCASFPGPHPLRLCPSCCVAYTWASDSPRAKVPECGDQFRGTG